MVMNDLMRKCSYHLFQGVIKLRDLRNQGKTASSHLTGEQLVHGHTAGELTAQEVSDLRSEL